MNLTQITCKLKQDIAALHFGQPVTHVYNPLVYACQPHQMYLDRFGQAEREVLLVGMNPGPFGMAQTGVPFGDVTMVRDWMGIEAPVGKPTPEHPARVVSGFDCPRSEVSGTRLWGWARDTFSTPQRFFARFYVANFCPLCFMEASGRNRTPDKLPVEEAEPLLAACRQALLRTVEYLQPRYVIGVGRYAELQVRKALGESTSQIGRILHPSPASPAANRGWAAAVVKDFQRIGIRL
jgi:single-strand selective monofunctional uracil DNA glycosylase